MRITSIPQHTKWLANRRRTFAAFCIICFGLGFEYSLIFPSLWYYISEVIKTNHDELYYGIALASYPVSSIIGAFTIARYADKSKKTRRVILVLIICEIIGNLLYMFHFSPFFPIAGRLIAGFGDVANMVMVAEIARSYETAEITSRISWTVMFFSIGFALAPGMNILFKLFDFHIGPLHVVYANMPGLFMAGCFSVIISLAYTMVSDVSKDFDFKAKTELVRRQSEALERIMAGKLKANREERHNTKSRRALPTIHDGEPIDLTEVARQQNKRNRRIERRESSRMFDTLKSILTTFDLVLLLGFGFVSSYTLFGFDTLMALIASKYLHFDVSRTSIIFIIDGVLYGGVLLGIKKASSKYTDYSIIIIAVVLQLFGLVAIMCLSLYNTNIYFNYASLSIYVLAFATTWSIEEVLTRSLFGKLVPSSCQSYAEGIRRSVSSTAFIISGVSTAGLFKALPIIAGVLIVLTLVLLGVFIYRRKTLMSPTPQFYFGNDDDEEALLSQNFL